MALTILSGKFKAGRNWCFRQRVFAVETEIDGNLFDSASFRIEIADPYRQNLITSSLDSTKVSNFYISRCFQPFCQNLSDFVTIVQLPKLPIVFSKNMPELFTVLGEALIAIDQCKGTTRATAHLTTFFVTIVFGNHKLWVSLDQLMVNFLEIFWA